MACACFLPVKHFDKVKLENLTNQTIVIGGAGVYAILLKNVAEIFRKCSQHRVQVYHPIFFENLTQTYSNGIIQLDTRKKHCTILNEKYKLIFESNKTRKNDPASYEMPTG